jgi:GT2 family glycosyltransferase
VRAFAAGFAVPVRYVFEPSQGLSHARNRGIREAAGGIAAFTDDDCIVDGAWIGSIVRAFGENPDVAIVGGRVDLFAPDDRPVSIRPLGERLRYAAVGDVFSHVMGCNMAIRRSLVDRIGWFDPALGGTSGVTADDIDFIYRALRRGVGVMFVPEIRVRHDHGRRTEESVRALARTYARGRGAFYCKHALRDRAVFREAYWEVRQCLAEAGGAARLRDLASGARHVVLTRAGLARR